MPAENKQAVPKLDFNTPDAGRAYIAKLFETVLRRHDYRQYISERLAGDFACTLAQHFEEIKARESALQLLLNERDEQNHSLEQRRQAEQQACQTAERRVRELQATLKDLISAVRSINRSPAYKVTVIGDDEPQYRQRKEWIDWVLELCDKAAAGIEQAAPVAVVMPDDWQDQMFAEMERRFSLSEQYHQDHLVNDDTQIGVEFAIEWIAARLDEVTRLKPIKQ